MVSLFAQYLAILAYYKWSEWPSFRKLLKSCGLFTWQLNIGFTDPLGLGPFCITYRHLTCAVAALWAHMLLNRQCRVELVKKYASVLLLEDGLVLYALHCLLLYSFRICRHLEGIKFQALSSCNPSPRLVTMAFHSSNLWQVPNFISSRHSFLLCCSFVSLLPLFSPFPLSPSFSHFCQSRNFVHLLNIPKFRFLWFFNSNLMSFKNDFVKLTEP